MADHDAFAAPPAGGPGSERLQALLSRAVQEQLDEQRQISAELAGLRTLVTGLDEQLRSGASTTRVDELASRVADLVAERVTAALVEQLAERVTTSVLEGLLERAREAGEDAERRITARVDDAVLALAEVVLRPRRRGSGAEPGPARAAEAEPSP